MRGSLALSLAALPADAASPSPGRTGWQVQTCGPYLQVQFYRYMQSTGFISFFCTGVRCFLTVVSKYFRGEITSFLIDAFPSVGHCLFKMPLAQGGPFPLLFPICLPEGHSNSVLAVPLTRVFPVHLWCQWAQPIWSATYIFPPRWRLPRCILLASELRQVPWAHCSPAAGAALSRGAGDAACSFWLLDPGVEPVQSTSNHEQCKLLKGV